jgi:type VI secretion system protein ImpM
MRMDPERHGGSGVGIFGKLPAQGDFLRLGASGPTGEVLVTWLHEAMEPVHRAGLALPAAPVRFLLLAPGAADAAVGTMIASRDRVGRGFPLCLVATVPASALARAFPALPAAASTFCDAAELLLGRAAELGGTALAEAARALPRPREARELEPSLAAAAAERSLADLLGGAFAGLPEGASAYGISTLAAALQQVRGGPPAKATLAIEGTARDDAERWIWLEIVRRVLRWSAPPGIFWTGDRLLVSLGPPPTTLLQQLCDPGRPPAKVWPLRTDRAEAITAARRGLAPELRRALEAPAGPATRLLDLLASGGGRA